MKAAVLMMTTVLPLERTMSRKSCVMFFYRERPTVL